MSDWLVAPGPASLDVAANLSAKLGAKLLTVETIDFPDGESKIRLVDEVRNKKVIVVQSTYPPVDKHLVQLLALSHKLSEEGADVYAAVPYLGYARQDKEFMKGEVVTLGVIAHLMRSVGIKRLVTVDIHSMQALGLFSFPVYSCSSIPLLADYISRNYDLQKPISVSPDFGSSARVEAFAAVLKSEFVSFKKRRDRTTGEISTEDQSLNLLGRDAVIIDDMISTGGSVVKCAQLLKKNHANRVIAACAHPVLVGGAADKIKQAGVDELLATNTIPSKYSKVDVSPLIANYFEML
ncbi:MAG TPA: ribose-phosphate pyrophosphokinase [Nitrososphaerales archaeon]|nr:ribose-phosphate pyrophosphokinase [Nitrososphaerales archaeon]